DCSLDRIGQVRTDTRDQTFALGSRFFDSLHSEANPWACRRAVHSFQPVRSRQGSVFLDKKSAATRPERHGFNTKERKTSYHIHRTASSIAKADRSSVWREPDTQFS